MNLCMLISRFPPTLGGAEIQCYRLSTWLARQGHRVVVLTEKSTPDQPGQEIVNGFEVRRFSTWGRRPFASFFYGVQAFIYLLTHKGFDVIHAHMIATPAMVGSLAHLFLRTPILIKVAGGRRTGDFSTSRTYVRGHFKLWVFKQGNPFVVCPSRETFDEARGFGIPADRLHYIPNGVDTDTFQPVPEGKSSLRASLKWPPNAPIVLYVGRWAKGKGVEALLDVWEKAVAQPDFPWHLALVLAEPAPEAMKRRINALKGRIHVAVGATETRPYYQAADLAMLLSEGEGLSNFLLEAMASGLPTVTTAAAALPDADGDRTGTKTLAADASAAQEALSYLTDLGKHPERLMALGASARRHIESHYSLNHVGEAYLQLYRKMKN